MGMSLLELLLWQTKRHPADDHHSLLNGYSCSSLFATKNSLDQFHCKFSRYVNVDLLYVIVYKCLSQLFLSHKYVECAYLRIIIVVTAVAAPVWNELPYSRHNWLVSGIFNKYLQTELIRQSFGLYKTNSFLSRYADMPARSTMSVIVILSVRLSVTRVLFDEMTKTYCRYFDTCLLYTSPSPRD